MNPPDHEEMTRQILKTAEEAAGKVRREHGFWANLFKWLEQRSQRRAAIKDKRYDDAQKELQRRRCRNDEHDVENWTFLRDCKVFSNATQGPAPEGSLPIRVDRTWIGSCVHCGAPDTRTKAL